MEGIFWITMVMKPWEGIIVMTTSMKGTLGGRLLIILLPWRIRNIGKGKQEVITHLLLVVVIADVTAVDATI